MGLRYLSISFLWVMFLLFFFFVDLFIFLSFFYYYFFVLFCDSLGYNFICVIFLNYSFFSS